MRIFIDFYMSNNMVLSSVVYLVNMSSTLLSVVDTQCLQLPRI